MFPMFSNPRYISTNCMDLPNFVYLLECTIQCTYIIIYTVCDFFRSWDKDKWSAATWTKLPPPHPPPTIPQSSPLSSHRIHSGFIFFILIFKSKFDIIDILVNT